MSGNIVVSVRCRPLNSRELARGAKELITMEGNSTTLHPPEVAPGQSGRAIDKKPHNFAFDKSYWSAGAKDSPGYASQQTLFDDLGKDLLDHSFEGYNTCIFAYGQTGSGKSYSMMGYGTDRGIIPLTCSDLFKRIDKHTTDLVSYTTEVSFIEIYNEKVRDLLNPKNTGNLKVREHPSMGPYVEDLSRLAVENYAGIENLMDEGNKARTVAATNMNETSSRSHSVFTVILTQRRKDPETGMTGEKVSKISLVDLAGSERANSTGATGQRLKEGANINRSLTTLGKVIAALASTSATPGKGKKKAEDFIPYRDSVLTWLLKESLGGNSKTYMIAAISPADYEETLSTLRYADQAKKIKNKAVVNEDPNAKLIRELKDELTLLRARMTGAAGESSFDPSVPPEQQIVTYQTKTGEIKQVTKAALQEQLETSEKLMEQVNQTWEEKMVKTQEIQKEREAALEELGITIEKNHVGVHTPKKMPHLVNLNEDPLMSECLIYQIKAGRTVVGNLDSDKPADIRLSGDSILPEHCYFEHSDGAVMLHAMPDSTTMVNGMRISHDKPRALKSGYRIILGDFHVFRFNHPEEVRKHREKVRSSMSISMTAEQLRSPGMNGFDEDHSNTGSPAARPDSPISSMSVAEGADWQYARREALIAKLNGAEVDLDSIRDDDLDKLFSDVAKARHMRKGTSVGRPESRMSYLESVDEDDDGETTSGGSPSRKHYSGSTWGTDATSLDSTLTYSGLNIPEVDERLKAVKDEMQTQLDTQRQAYEQRMKEMSQTVTEADDFKSEKEQMQKKLKLVQGEMQRMLDTYRHRHGASSPDSGSFYDIEFVTFTDEQLRLIKFTLARWRRQRKVSMAEEALSKAVLLKEANVISREFDKDVTYQFTVVGHDSGATSASALETISGLLELEDVTDPALAATPRPCIAVKVLDHKNRSVYVWSVEKLQQRLQQMQNLNKYMNTEYSRHFSFEDPFYESSPPAFSFVGSATIALGPLARNRTSCATVQIVSPFTLEPIGSCRISLKPVSITRPVAVSSTPTTPSSSGEPSLSPSTDLFELPVGGKLSVQVVVDKVSGLSSSEFSAAHCQIRLSSIAGETVSSEQILPSEAHPVTNGPSDLKLSRQLSLDITHALRRHLAASYSSIDFFAELKATHVQKLARWDEMQAGGRLGKQLNGHENGVTGEAVAGRRPETELVQEQQHDVMASLQVCELAANGEYQPVQVIAANVLDPGAFLLHQGLQRRIVLRLSHNSGRQWPWKRISKIELGNVRLLDPKGRMHSSTSTHDVEVRPMGKHEAQFRADGTSAIVVTAPWDSGSHDCIFLNRTTASGHRVLLRLNFEVEAENCAEPVAFNMDVGVTISGRDARAPLKLMSFLSNSRVLFKVSNLFAVRLTPFMPKKSKDIWRLNTADKRVRGEEVLGSWRPLGISLVKNFTANQERQRLLADVEAAKAIVSTLPPLLPISVPTDGQLTDAQELQVRKALKLWTSKFGTKDDIKLIQEPTFTDIRPVSPAPSTPGRKPRERKLMGTATLVARTDAAQKRGYLALLRDPSSNRWVRRWMVLRRPYLHQYHAPNEVEDDGPINISTVRIDHNPEMETMLGRSFVFAVYTQQNCYFFGATNRRDMEEWLDQLDPSWRRVYSP